MEEDHYRITLTNVMWIKPLATLLIALVFQLAQLLPTAAAMESCAVVASSCECCDPHDSCPCAANDETPQQQAPLSSEVGSSLKVPVAKATGTRVTLESIPETRPSVSVVLPSTGPPSGYTGVRVSVAFCSFVI